MQTKTVSFIEATCNTATGFVVSWTLTMYLLPYYGYIPTLSEAWQITFIFTIISIARSYIWRRLFNFYERITL